VRVVDNSILAATAKCHTYAYVRYAMGLEVRGTGLPLVAGHAVHLGMERWLTGAKPKAAVVAMAEEYESAVAEYLRTQERDNLSGDEGRFEPERVEAIFAQHLAQLEERFPFTVVSAQVETPISAPFGSFGGEETVYSARLDAIVRKRDGGERWSMDHKTTKKVTDWWKEKQKTSSQWSGQVWIGKQEGEQKLAGVVLHVIELPEPYTSTKTCRDHGVPYVDCSIRHASYDYIYITRSPAELEAWELSARKLAGQYARLEARAREYGLEAIGTVPMQGRFNDGCTFCDMKEWCRLGRNTSARVVKATFRASPWDPMKQQEVVA